MKRAVLFDDFSTQCDFFDPEDEDTNGNSCTHPDQDGDGCYCCSCPLGVEAEQEDRDDPAGIDWDGLCEDGEVTESEYLLVNTGDDATDDEKQNLYNYDRYMHRYDKKWLDEHGISNFLCS